ncbi:MAG: GRAS family protein [Chitinophagaceae bacterium]
MHTIKNRASELTKRYPVLARLFADFAAKNLPLDALFLEHLQKGLEERSRELPPEKIVNTYLKDYEIPQIVLFDILANRFPLVTEAQALVHRTLSSEAKGCRHLVIIDLGIGRGVQLMRMLQHLQAHLSLSSITVIGVELIREALEHTTQLMEQATKQAPGELRFIPLNSTLESLQRNEVAQYIPASCDFVFVNASLSLHHLQQQDERKILFQKVSSWKPDLFTIIEPNAATFTEHFETRLYNAAEHFNALYNFTDTLELKPEEKRTLKMFFSNDFFDPLALPEAHRFEKLERAERWIEYGDQAGLRSFALDEWAKPIHIREIQISGSPQPFINFNYRGVDLLATIALS